MPHPRACVAALTVLALTACFNSTEPVPGDSSIQVVNATLGWIDVSIDGRSATFGGVSMNGVSNILTMPAGIHRLRLGLAMSPATELTLVTKRDTQLTLVAYPTGSAGVTGPATMVLVDTGAFVPIGKSRLRVANLTTAAGAIEIWRSLPGSPVGSRIMTPFPSGAVSAYQESDPGVSEVWTTAVGSETKTASSGPIEIPTGERRTVLLLDSPAGPRFVVVAD